MKLLNSTDATPNENSHGAAHNHEIYEFQHLLARNSSWSMPLNWTISNVSKDLNQGYVTIKSLDINNHHVDGLNATSLEGEDFRMVIELWRYDTKTQTFVFQGFPENDDNMGAWNQVWFSLKA
jgi:hypothetical protein